MARNKVVAKNKVDVRVLRLRSQIQLFWSRSTMSTPSDIDEIQAQYKTIKNDIQYIKTRKNAPAPTRTHKKCIDNTYLPEGYIKRGEIPNMKWSNKDDGYAPPEFNARDIVDQPAWADPMELTKDFIEELRERKTRALGFTQLLSDYMPKGNSNDLKSYLPMNPIGRTGLRGRGSLGKYGPNNAADPLFTRVNPETGNLQMIAIKRKDNRLWAIPGGMVDAGEVVARTLKREFAEEALGVEEHNPAKDIPAKEIKLKPSIQQMFDSGGVTVYVGYVDDPRNTDNAWMETTCVHYHAEDTRLIEDLTASLKPGSDAGAVEWLDISRENLEFENLYADHKMFVIRALLLNPKKFAKYLKQFDDQLELLLENV